MKLPLYLLLLTSSLFSQPLFVVTQPKSGTSYISAQLSSYFGGKLSHLQLSYSPSVERIKKLSNSADIPIIDHFNFKQSHIDAIHEMGNRVVFIPRDPRQAVVSMAIHRVVHNGSHNLDTSLDPESYFEEIQNYLRQVFKSLFDRRMEQLKLWARNKQNFPETVCILPFEEMKIDRSRFFRRLFRHFGLTVDLRRIHPPRLGRARYRNSSENEWKKYLDDDLRVYADQALSDDLLHFYGWKR